MASSAGAPLCVRILGNVALEIDGTPFTLVSQRSTLPLLAYLLLNRGAPVARDFLAFLLAPDEEEESARLKLRNNLYRLSRGLPQVPSVQWIVADGETVQWNPTAPTWLDIDEFESASRDPSRLEEAVELYRGDLLATLYDEWLVEPRERARNLYLADLAGLVSQHRRDRHFARALQYAQLLLNTDPFREDVLRRLIGIRHAMGDRAGALREYAGFVERLRTELDIEPMPETTALRDAIARDDTPEVDAADVSAAVALPPRRRHDLPFIGRTLELEQFGDAWSRATRSRGGCLLLGGEGGIGKSRLALEFAQRAEEAGGRVLSGTTGSPEAVPYQGLIEALRFALPLLASLRIDAVWLASLATLLPELTDHIPTNMVLPSVSPEDQRSRLSEAFARCFSGLSKSRPLLVVLEDVHAAGESTLAALEYLARRALSLPILFVATYRGNETPRSHPLRRLRRDGQNRGVVRSMTLGPLSRSDIVTLGERMSMSPQHTAALYEVSSGNPLFLSQLIDVPAEELAARGASGVRRLIAQRFDERSAEARTVAEIAALMGTRFSSDAVAEVVGWSDDALRNALDELIDHRIVREAVGGGFFDYALVHDVVTEAIATSVPAERARRRHRRIARVLAELAGGDASEIAATVARQYDLAGDPDAAAPVYLEAARRAHSIGALDEAQSLAARGCTLATDSALRFDLLAVQETVAARKGLDEARRALLDQLQEIAVALGDLGRQRHCALQRVELAHQTSDRVREAAALQQLRTLIALDGDWEWAIRLHNAEAQLAIQLGQFDDADRAAAAALALALSHIEPSGEAQARSLVAEIATMRGDLATAQRLLEEARAAVERANDARLAEHLYRLWFQFAFARRDLAGCLEIARATLDTAIEAGDRRAEAMGHERLALSMIPGGGRYAEAREHLRIAATIATEIGDPLVEARTMSRQAQLAETLGDFSTAEHSYETYFAVLPEDAEPRRRLIALLNLSSIRAFQRRGAEAKKPALEALEIARRHGFAVLEASAMENLASSEAACGDHIAAIETMERALTMRSDTASSAWTGVTLANLALWYAIVGDLKNARRCVDHMLEAEDTIRAATSWPQSCYWVAAQVTRLSGDDAEAQRLLQRAQSLLRSELERVDEGERETYLSIPCNRDIVAAHERNVWPDPPR